MRDWDYFASPYTGPPRQQRRAGRALGNAGRAFLIAAAVILVVGGLVLAGFIVLLAAGLNSWGSNK